MALVSLAEAKDHLREENDLNNGDVLSKVEAAESIVLDYIGATATWRTVSAAWTDATVPALVKAAILIQLGELYGPSGRGDDAKGPPQVDGQLSLQLTNMLRRYRDPVLA
jgi:hypothetical protein